MSEWLCHTTAGRRRQLEDRGGERTGVSSRPAVPTCSAGMEWKTDMAPSTSGICRTVSPATRWLRNTRALAGEEQVSAAHRRSSPTRARGSRRTHRHWFSRGTPPCRSWSRSRGRRYPQAGRPLPRACFRAACSDTDIRRVRAGSGRQGARRGSGSAPCGAGGEAAHSPRSPRAHRAIWSQADNESPREAGSRRQARTNAASSGWWFRSRGARRSGHPPPRGARAARGQRNAAWCVVVARSSESVGTAKPLRCAPWRSQRMVLAKELNREKLRLRAIEVL